MTSSPWATVWSQRDDDRADWNGYEACFETSDAYDRFITRAAHFIAGTLELTTTDTLLDIGCGSGRFSAPLAERVEHVVGIDISPAALAAAEQHRPDPRVRYEQVDLNETDLQVVRGFSKSVAFGCFLYLSSQQRVREIMTAVTQTADLLALDMPDASIPDERPRDYNQSVYRHLRFSEEEILRWFPDATILHDVFPGYVNSQHRFAVLIPRRQPQS